MSNICFCHTKKTLGLGERKKRTKIQVKQKSPGHSSMSPLNLRGFLPPARPSPV